MKKFLLVFMKVTCLFLIAWLIMAQGCMMMRTADNKAVDEFAKANVHLTISNKNIAGHNLHYVSTGNADLPTLVFVHGSPGSWDAFEDYLKDSILLLHFHMVSIDRPGFGFSEFGKAEDMNMQSQIISPLLHDLKNNKPMFLVGHSLGGPVIVKLAADNPGLINGMVILAGSVDPNEEPKENWRNPLVYSPLRYFIPGAMRPSDDEILYFKKDVDEMPADLAKITCPVFIVHGNMDPMVPYGNALYAKSKLVNAKSVELTTINGANHFIPWEHYKEIKEVLLKLVAIK